MKCTRQDQHQIKSDMKSDRKDAHSVEYSYQQLMQGACVAKLCLEQSQEVRKDSYFFAALTRDTTSLSLSW